MLNELEKLALRERAPLVMLSMKLFSGSPDLLRFEDDALCLTLNLTRCAQGLEFLARLDQLSQTAGLRPHIIKDSPLAARGGAFLLPGAGGVSRQTARPRSGAVVPLGAIREAGPLMQGSAA